MLRRIFVFFFLLCSMQVYAQRRPDTKLFIDVSFGTSNAVEPYKLGYRSSTFGLFHAELGARILMNDYFGY